MPAIYDATDLSFSWNGDFQLGHDKDLGDTSDDTLLSLRQEIHTVAASMFRDWEIYPNLGAGLDDFVGEPNIKATGDRIHDRLRLSITSNNLVAEEDLEIVVVPVHIYKVLILVKINAAPTPFNKITSQTQPLVVSLVFDFVEQGLYVLEKIPNYIGRLR